MNYQEKMVPAYKLDIIKSLIRQRKYFITKTATDNAMRDFGLRQKEILNYVLNIENSNFYKSMTSQYDNRIWQDVYHVPVERNLAYVKLQIVDKQSVVISFKRK